MVKKRSISHLEAIFRLATKYKVRTLKVDGLELTFGEGEEPVFVTEPKIAKVENERQPSEDEMLFYSTEHFDELRSERT